MIGALLDQTREKIKFRKLEQGMKANDLPNSSHFNWVRKPIGVGIVPVRALSACNTNTKQ